MIAQLIAAAVFAMSATHPAREPHVAPVNAPVNAPADVADSLWRVARAAISDERWDRAVQLFAQLRTRYPRSVYVGDSYYWQAFALYQQGGNTALRDAVKLLDLQQDQFAAASTQKNGESRGLRTRIRGILAKNGDAGAAADIARRADRAVGASSGSSSSSSSSSSSGASAGTSGRSRGVTRSSGCKDEDEDDRVEALNALLQMDGDRALPILKSVMARRDACSEILRRKAVFLISQKRGDESLDMLLAAARNDPDSEVREQAVFWLGQTHSDKAVDMLADILKTSTDEDMLDKAIFALAQTKSAKGAALLRDYASKDGGNQDVREKAVFWLGQERSEENATFLKQLFGKTKNEDLQEKILFSLSQQRNSGNGQFLIDQAMDAKNSVDVRKKAIFWAGQTGAVDVAKIGTLYDKATDADFKEHVIFVLSQRKDADAVTKLMDIARTDKDRDMRSKAIFWLGQSRDPRALKMLQDIVTKPED